MMNENQTSAQQQPTPDNVHKEQGLLEEAVQYYQAELANCPDNAELWFNLGTALTNLSGLPEAAAALQQAIALKPDLADAYTNWGYALKKQGLTEDALQCYQKGLAVCPDNVLLWYNSGTLLLELHRLPEAVAALQQAIALKPDLVECYVNLGNAFKEQGLTEDAIQCCRQGLTVRPSHVLLWYNLGNNLLELHRLPEAAAALQQAITLKPDFTDAYVNLGNALQSQGKAEEAIAAFSRAIELNPSNQEVYYNRATAILLNGNLARGFAEYECRTQIKRFHHFYEWCDDIPRWKGEIFSGKRLLIFHEQGFGDALQASRYLPLVKMRGGIVHCAVKQPLLRLFGNFPGIDELIEHTAPAIAGAQADLAVPIMSLPYIFGTTLPAVPACVPFPIAAQHCLDAWQNKINRPASNLRVGLVWAGNQTPSPARIRTCGLTAMTPLAGIPGVAFYSLQKGAAATEAKTPPPGMNLIDLTDDIADFADTAALIMSLDLVISVDTAVAHLAGTLGKPVWTLLPAAGEWRWLSARNDSPWYPTMRLFRQSAPGDWSGVMTEVAQELRTLLSTTAKVLR